MWPELKIEDYSNRTAQTIEAWKGINGKQSGPAKLVSSVVRLVDSDEPPHRCIAGADAMEGAQRTRATLEA